VITLTRRVNDVSAEPRGRGGCHDPALGPVLAEAVRLATGMLLNAVEAEDAVQEACVRAWRSRANRRPGSRLRPWFLGIVANQCREARRARWWQVLRIAEPSVSSPAKRDDLSARSDLRDALSRLPYRRRLAIVLRYYLDLSFEDVAATAGCSVDAAKALVRRGIADLQRALATPRADG
jgi:RNA polymerase sigma-70 factor (ECF subfamily)